LNKFLTERGKIIPSRVSGVSMKKQKALANAIKLARHMALISPVSKDLIN
jgi:small subunit ribosomal protein S18